MAETQLLINTQQGAHHYIEGSFTKPPVDLRYDQVRWVPFYPLTSIDSSSNTVSFECPHWATKTGRFFYFL